MELGKTILALSLIALIAVSACVQGEAPAYQFEYESHNALFGSDTTEPKQLLNSFAVKKHVVLAIELDNSGQSGNPEKFNRAFIPFYAVIAGNDRNAIQLVMFKDGSAITECQTNFGDLKTLEYLDESECLEMLFGEKSDLVIFFPSPDESIPRSHVFLEEKRIIVKAKNADDQYALSTIIMAELFPNYAEILERANEKLKQLG